MATSAPPVLSHAPDSAPRGLAGAGAKLRAAAARLAIVGIFLLFTGLPLLKHFAVLEPLFFPLRYLQNETVQVGRVTFGPFPQAPVLAQLKASGYEEVITLLNPSLPQERSLIDKELSACREHGLKCTNMPLSYFPRVHTLNNYARAAKIAQYVDGRRVYVHCYLGMHRAMLVAETLEGARPKDVMQSPQ